MKRKPWKDADELFRGDEKDAVSVPDPDAKTGIVEHILFLGGKGRDTAFSSTTESEEAAEHFAGSDGRVWETDVATAATVGARHWSRSQLLRNLKGLGKGRAKWHDAFEVKQAAAYVALWSEHLLDWKGTDPLTIEDRIKKTFRKA